MRFKRGVFGQAFLWLVILVVVIVLIFKFLSVGSVVGYSSQHYYLSGDKIILDVDNELFEDTTGFKALGVDDDKRGWLTEFNDKGYFLSDCKVEMMAVNKRGLFSSTWVEFYGVPKIQGNDLVCDVPYEEKNTIKGLMESICTPGNVNPDRCYVWSIYGPGSKVVWSFVPYNGETFSEDTSFFQPPSRGFFGNLWDSIINFFKNLFGGPGSIYYYDSEESCLVGCVNECSGPDMYHKICSGSQCRPNGVTESHPDCMKTHERIQYKFTNIFSDFFSWIKSFIGGFFS